MFTHCDGHDSTVFSVILPFPPHWTGLFSWMRLSRSFYSIFMASSTSSYSFNEDEITQLARCTDQAEFLYLFKRILQSKSIDLSAVFDAERGPNFLLFKHTHWAAGAVAGVRPWCNIQHEIIPKKERAYVPTSHLGFDIHNWLAPSSFSSILPYVHWNHASFSRSLG